MANLPLAFGELLAGGIFIVAAATGDSLGAVVRGTVQKKPLPGAAVDTSHAGADIAAGSSSSAGAIVGSPLAGVAPHAATHPTLGLAGYPAYDYMAKAGTAVLAPVGGTIERLSGHDPASGAPQGPHGPFGWSVYLKGDDGKIYFLTHLGALFVRAGQRVVQGARLATVGDYARFGGADHVHVGVHG